jgi:hypothetical protein
MNRISIIKTTVMLTGTALVISSILLFIVACMWSAGNFLNFFIKCVLFLAVVIDVLAALEFFGYVIKAK